MVSVVVGFFVGDALEEFGETADGAGVTVATGGCVGLREPEALLGTALADGGAAASGRVAHC